jgi:hypothetical protein
MSQILIDPQRVWNNQVAALMDVLAEALLDFRTAEGQKELAAQIASVPNKHKELQFNRFLYRRALDANRRLMQENKGLVGTLHLQCANSPRIEDVEYHPSEEKLPDLCYMIKDPTIIDTDGNGISFCIECKRLGTPPSKRWILNKEYVISGIERFVTDEHRYGRSAASGLMIGYVESMEFEDILKEVNIHITERSSGRTDSTELSLLKLKDDNWGFQGVSHLNHENALKRPFPISPFMLYHMWIDIRPS